MLLENNWLKTNIKEIAVDNSKLLNVQITNYPYTKKSFIDASKDVCFKIADMNKPIYVAYSGGMDSEFVISQFKKYNIPFTAITTLVKGNLTELQYARHYYKKNPEIIKIVLRDILDQKVFFTKFYNLVKTFNCPAVNAVQILHTAEYVKAQNGIMVIGDHLIGSTHNPNDNIMLVGTSEWDHYYDNIDEKLVVPFFYYDLPITQSFVSQFNTMEHDEFKEYMYDGIPYRPKMVPDYRKFVETNKIYNDIISTIVPKTSYEVTYTKEQFLTLIG